MERINQKDVLGEIVARYVSLRYARYVGVVLGATILLGTGYFGYGWHVQQREANAQFIFGQALEEFQTAVEQDNDAAWSSAQDALRAGHQEAAGTDLAPYFLSFQADVLVKQNKLVEALDLMDAMLEELPTSSPLYQLFKVKRALMQIDTGDTIAVQQGIDTLRAVSKLSGTYHAEVAAYFLGTYFASREEYQQAELVWRQLVNSVDPEYAKTSPWVAMAESRLKTL